MTRNRKPNGYWNDFSNVERELLAFIEEHGTPGVMPTYEALTKAGRGDLAQPVRKYGGPQAVAERLGLTYGKKRHGYWDEFSNLEYALLEFIERYDTPGVMPTREDLKNAGRGDLEGAINKRCPNSVVEGWEKAILDIFPDSVVAKKTFMPDWKPNPPARILLANQGSYKSGFSKKPDLEGVRFIYAHQLTNVKAVATNVNG